MDQDAEITAMSAVAKAPEPLEEDVRQRVISWNATRVDVSFPEVANSCPLRSDKIGNRAAI
jgi:hypothetical protein